MKLIRSTGAFLLFFAVGLVLTFALLGSSNWLRVAVAAAIGLPFFAMTTPAAALHGWNKLRGLAATWTKWHTLWLFVFLSSLIFRIRDTQQINNEALDPWAAYRIAVMALVGATLVALLAFGKSHWVSNLFRGVTGAYALYAGFNVVSTAWSIYPAWTLYKSGEILIDIVLITAIVVAMQSDWEFKSIFDLTYVLYGLLLVTTWIGAAVWPHLALLPSRGLIGVQLYGVVPAVHTNSVGEYAAIIGVVAALRIKRARDRGEHKTFYWFAFALAVGSLVASQTRSAEVAFLASMFVCFVLVAPRATIAVAGIGGGMVLVTGLSALLLRFFERGQSQQVLASATGRFYWWSYAWQMFLEHPIAGSGAFAAGRFGVLKSLDPKPSNVHNSFLEVMVGTGSIGAVLLAAALLMAWYFLMKSAGRRSTSDVGHQLSLEALGILVILSIRGMLSGVIVLHAPMFFLLVLGYAEYVRRARAAAPDTVFDFAVEAEHATA